MVGSQCASFRPNNDYFADLNIKSLSFKSNNFLTEIRLIVNHLLLGTRIHNLNLVSIIFPLFPLNERLLNSIFGYQYFECKLRHKYILQISKCLWSCIFFIIQNCSFFMSIIFCSSVALVWTFNTRGGYNFITKEANIPVNLIPIKANLCCS